MRAHCQQSLDKSSSYRLMDYLGLFQLIKKVFDGVYALRDIAVFEFDAQAVLFKTKRFAIFFDGQSGALPLFRFHDCFTQAVFNCW